jgi:hypothetical protein
VNNFSDFSLSLRFESTDVLNMKVIVQDLETGAYLSADGRWVAAKSDARDFLTLLRAYHFAKDNTSKHFQVLLHSPDDEYCSCIIDGMGTAMANAKAANAEAAVMPVKAPTAIFRQPAEFRRRSFRSYSNRLDWTRNELN